MWNSYHPTDKIKRPQDQRIKIDRNRINVYIWTSKRFIVIQMIISSAKDITLKLHARSPIILDQHDQGCDLWYRTSVFVSNKYTAYWRAPVPSVKFAILKRKKMEWNVDRSLWTPFQSCSPEYNRKFLLGRFRKSRKRQALSHMMSVLNRKLIYKYKCLISCSLLNGSKLGIYLNMGWKLRNMN